MRNRLTLSSAIVLLLCLLPATAAAVTPKIPYVMAGAWPLTREELPPTAGLAAWDVNWRVVQPSIIQLGYARHWAGGSERVVEATITVNQSEKHPQHLYLAGEAWRCQVAEDCADYQFINLRDRDSTIRVMTLSPVADVCIDP